MMDDNTIKEDFLRWAKYCVGCGREKGQGLIVCLTCYNHSKYPYIHNVEKIELWLAKMYGQDINL